MVDLALEKFGSADLLVASAGISAGKFFIETRPGTGTECSTSISAV
jgi:hypothetical protein